MVMFQEVVYLPELSAHNQAQLLNAELGYRYENCAVSRLQEGIDYKVYREGLGIISRHPILQSDVVVLKQAEGDHHQRIVQLIDLLINGEVVKIANIHFSLTDDVDFATAHLQETLDLLRARGEDRVIAGDFNMKHLENLADLWQDHYSASTDFDYVSYPAENKRIDYFLVPKKYTLTTLTTADDQRISDHLPLTATIETPGHSGDWRDHLRDRLSHLRNH